MTKSRAATEFVHCHVPCTALCDDMWVFGQCKYECEKQERPVPPDQEAFCCDCPADDCKRRVGAKGKTFCSPGRECVEWIPGRLCPHSECFAYVSDAPLLVHLIMCVAQQTKQSALLVTPS